MQLLIDKKELELLLEKKREFIGNKVAIDTIIAAISFLLSACTANYDKILGVPGIVIKTVFCVIGIAYGAKVFVDFFKSCYNKYDHIVLKKEIENLNMIQHNHSLIIIKSKDISEKERFLVYYDERWDCKLFLNYKTQDRNNEEAIIDQACADLQLDKKEISIRYITSRVQEKYSVSHDEYRMYNHRLYELEIHNWQKEEEKDFSVNGRHYYWMTIPEMEQDENIVRKNIEVVDFVKEAILL